MAIDPRTIQWDEPQVQQPDSQGIVWDDPDTGEFEPLIQEAAQKYGLDVGKLKKQIQTESSFNPQAVSPAGAMGLMQLMPGTAKDLGVRDPFDPAQNIDAGARYMRQMLDANEQDMKKALAAYNWGPGNLKKKGIENAPKETRNYLESILGEGAKEIGRVIDTGVKGGLGALPQMAAKGTQQISDFAQQGAEAIGVPSIPGLRDLPAPTDLMSQLVDRIFAPIERPKTEAGQTAANITAAGVGALTGPGALTAPGKALMAGLSSGVGAEIGGELGGTGGAIAGGLLGGFAPSVAGRFAPSSARGRVAKDALEGVTPEELARAQATMEAGKREGIDLTLAQALGRQTGVDRLEAELVNSKAGLPLAQQLRDQPRQIQAATRRNLAELPGTVRGQQETANLAQQAASGALGKIKAERTQAVKPIYAEVGSIAEKDARDMFDSLRPAIKQAGKTNRAKTLTTLYNKLAPVKTVIVDGEEVRKRKPLTDVQLIDDTLRELEKKMSLKPKDPRAQALIEEQIDGIRNQLGILSPKYKEASDEYARISRETVNPAEQGALGLVAQRTGYDPRVAANRTNLFGVFDRGTAEGGKSEILTLQRDMAKTPEGKQAFADSGVSWLSDKINSAIKFEGDELSPATARNIQQALYGDANTARGTRDVLAGIAKSQGLPENVLVDGMENWAKTVRLAAKRPSSTGGVSAQELRETGRTAADKLAKSGVFQVLVNVPAQALRGFDKILGKKTNKDLAIMLQSPEGVEQLKKLARLKPGSPASITAMQTLGAIMARQQTEEE